MRTINEIIIHCSGTPAGQPVSVESMRRYHVHQRGWRDIGYHFIIYLDGSVRHGRPVAQAGAHCRGHNSHSMGICYVGGLDSSGRPCDTRTPAQKAAMARLVRELKAQYPAATVHGHCEFAAKACPCFDVQRWWADVQTGTL